MYEVTIQATITKTYTIEADSQDEAIMTASDRFELLEEDGISETYEQDILEVCFAD